MSSVSRLLEKPQYGQPLTNKAQVMLEFTFCFIIVAIFFAAIFMALVWTGRMFVARQKAYEATRQGGQADFYQPGNITLIPTINRD